MENIFNYARNKIKKKYENCTDYSPESSKILEKSELFDIDYYEKEAKANFVSQITCRIKAVWYVQPSDRKVEIFLIIAAILFETCIFFYNIDDTPLNILLINTSKDCFAYFTLLGVAFIYCLIRKNAIKSKLFYIVWITTLLLSIPQMPVLFGYETTQIGDFYEAKEYTEEYYVIMSRQPKEVKNRKVYMLPAKITRMMDYSYTTDVHEDYYSNEHGGQDVYALTYHITRLNFANGGYLKFNCDSSDSIVQVREETEVIDSHDDIYYITLTKEKVIE